MAIGPGRAVASAGSVRPGCADFTGCKENAQAKMMLSSSFGCPGAKRTGSPSSKPEFVATSTRDWPASAGSVIAVRCSTNGVWVAVGAGSGLEVGTGVLSSSPPPPPPLAGGVAVAMGVPLLLMLMTGLSEFGSNETSAWVPSAPSIVAIEEVPSRP